MRVDTQNFIDGKITSAEQSRLIVDAYENVSAKSDAVLCEGTGHVGVGSIIELSNAAVAAKLGADVILVANGGLGSAFDELEMNRIQVRTLSRLRKSAVRIVRAASSAH